MTLAEESTHTPTWTPFREWTTTLERRQELALYLASLAQFEGMGDTVAVGLAELAGHLEDPERWLRFEVLTEALRDRRYADDHDLTKACARVDDAVADLCEVTS